VSRHARAAHVVVRLQQRDDVLRVQVEDDGVGFDPAAERERAQGLGLRGMEERAQQIGARFAMESTPNRGTTITLEVRHQPVIHTGGS
jgi:signal transduction histidine kinase